MAAFVLNNELLKSTLAGLVTGKPSDVLAAVFLPRVEIQPGRDLIVEL